MTDINLDDVDRKIIHALQIEPRAPWSAVSAAVGASAATVARRWNRLQEEGIAWVTGHRQWLSSTASTTLIEIGTEPNATDSVIAALTPVPAIFTICRTTGARDLLLALRADSTMEGWRFINQFLSRIPGIRSFHTHPIISMSAEGKNWTLRALSQAKAKTIPPAPLPRPRAPRTIPADLQRIIVDELSMDGRASATAIGEKWGYQSQRISDAIAVLRAENKLLFRTDVSQAATGFPICVWYFIKAPAATVQQLSKALTQVPEIRVIATTAGRYHLVLAIWLRSLSAIFDFEISLERAAEDARVVDKAVITADVKRTGRLFTEDGLATAETIPITSSWTATPA